MRRCYWMLIAVVGLLIVACGGNADGQNSAIHESQEKALNHNVYIPQNDLELNNYNARQIIADDPTTILWCTYAWPVAGSPLVTVPIVGKLTSGNKRPYPSQQVVQLEGEDASRYNPEVPGPDGMYGDSGDYRYGFSPDGAYQDFYGMPTQCTTEPTVFQKDETTIAFKSDEGLLKAQNDARDLLRQGKTDEAQKVLEDAIEQAQP